MRKEELLQLAEKAIARWNDPELPKLPGVPTVKVCLMRQALQIEIAPGIVGQYLGKTPTGKYVYLLSAAEILEHLSE